MKQFRTAVAAALVLSTVPPLAHAQERGEAKLALAGKAIVIEYGRPALNKRDVWKDLVTGLAVGSTWRMGAGAATTLKTDGDLQFGSVTLPKGTYTLEAKRVDETKWSLLFKKPSATADSLVIAAEAPLTSATVKESAEHFTIELRGAKNAGEFEMRWGTTALRTAFTAK